MKKFLIVLWIVAISFLAYAYANAFGVKLGWTYPDANRTDILGFKVKISDVQGIYSNATIIDIPDPMASTFIIPNFENTFPKTVYYFVMTAYNDSTSSFNSTELKYTRPVTTTTTISLPRPALKTLQIIPE